MAINHRLGADAGGTFTDFVLLNEESGALEVLKVPSTPANPAQAMITGVARLRELGFPPEALNFLSHGTTVATNDLLQLKGCKAGLLTTEGFKYIYDIGTMARPAAQVFDIYYSKPPRLVQPRFIGEIKERVDYQGKVVEALDEEQAKAVIADLLEKGIESIAVCLLFSFLNPKHELRLRELIREQNPATRVSLSCEILPKIREYPRTSTTVVNAYLSPKLEGYLEELEQKLVGSGVKSKLFIMQSNGGIMPVDSAKGNAAFTLLSGPVAGVMAGNYIGKLCGFKNLITIDVGGTSTDVALIHDNQPMFTSDGEIAGQPVGLPMVDMHTLGAGGGSIGWLDEGGRLHVGPQSAGADPGPACYGLGGKEPALTDAYMTLGFMNPDFFAGGQMRVDKRLSEEAIKRLADKAGMDPIQMADGITKLANANIEAGIRLVSIQKGYDPRDFVLLAFGGAGALGAALVAKDLEIAHVLVPYQPGATAALGLLVADPKHSYVRSKIEWFSEVQPKDIETVFEELEAKGKETMTGEGFARDEILLHRSMGLRYIGQGYEVAVPVAKRIATAEDKQGLRDLFDNLHENLYGHRASDQPLETVYYQVDAVVPTRLPNLAEAAPGERGTEDAVKGHRQVYFPEGARFVETPIYDRERLGAGMMIAGPAIIEEQFSTVVVYPGHKARVDRYRNILIGVRG